MTLNLLWQEYKEQHPDGYQYSWFCQHYRAWSARLDVVMRHEHRAGEKLFVDYAGQTREVVDPVTGRLPLADSNDQSAKVHQQLMFWELMQRYRETEESANQVDHDLRNQAHRCRFSEEELDEAELIFREVLKGRGEFCDFSSRQIGRYIKPAPWHGC